MTVHWVAITESVQHVTGSFMLSADAGESANASKHSVVPGGRQPLGSRTNVWPAS